VPSAEDQPPAGEAAEAAGKESGADEAAPQASGGPGPDEAAAHPEDAAGDAGSAASERRPEAEHMMLRGEVLNGPECPVLKTPEGDLYSLVSAEYGFTPGDYVEIEGETVDLSFCADGQATVRVTSMSAVPAPQGG
jgi:hypothetical protein